MFFDSPVKSEKMKLGEKCGSNMRSASEGYGMGLVRSTSFGRKRVALCIIDMEFGYDDDCNTIPKRPCFQDSFLSGEKSVLEELPQEIQNRILCGVDHDDLKRLFFVSKAIREVTLLAKKSHFAYSTPRRKTMRFQNIEDLGDSNEVEAPNAPKQSRVPRFRLSTKKLADISVALFPSGKEDGWPQKDILTRIEMEM